MKKLRRIGRSLVRSIVRDPSIKVHQIQVKAISTTRFDSAKERTCYVVRICTNRPSLIRGDVQAFKGSYKERIEAVLDFIAKQTGADADVHVEITGRGLAAIERLIPIREMIAARQIKGSSPLVSVARRYGIPYVLVRGRHLVGPSPAVARVVGEVIGEDREGIKKTAELFAGTGIATKVICCLGSPERMIIVEKDPQKVSKMREYIRDPRVDLVVADARKLELEERYDLLVADPYYEDVQDFLARQLPQIARHTKSLILVSGGIENESWNEDVSLSLRRAGFKARRREAFGQVIFVGSKSHTAKVLRTRS